MNQEIDNISENLNNCQTLCNPVDEIEGGEENEKEDIEYRTKDPVRKQVDYDATTCMIP